MDFAGKKVVLTVPYPQGLRGIALGRTGSWLAVVGATQGGFPDRYPVDDEAALSRPARA